MKKLISVFLALILLITSSANAISVIPDQPVLLSELSDERLMEFVADNGAVISANLAKLSNIADIVRGMVQKVEENPNYAFLYNYYPTLELANSIKTIVNEHYGISSVSVCATSATIDSSRLSENTFLYTTWNSKYLKYNCYAFAINYTTNYTGLEDTPRYTPGDFYRTQNPYFGELDLSWNAQSIAGYIGYDLEVLGYDIASISTTMPNLNTMDPSHSVICFRKTSDNADYHLMRYDEAREVWTHKPGSGIPMAYDYTPTTANAWTGEGYGLRDDLTIGYFDAIEDYYDGTIYFIEYIDPNYYDESRVGSEVDVVS